MIDGLLWGLARLLPRAPERPWLAVPRGDGRIGPEWPRRWAADQGASAADEPDGGLLPDLSRLGDVALLDPAVRTFYAHTARYEIAVRARWGARTPLPGWLWSLLFARRWGQLDLPTADAPLTNEILSVSAPAASIWWVRRYAGDRALYVSTYSLVAVAGESDPGVRIVFPVPGGAWVVLFRPVVVDGALVLTEAGGRAGGPGLYLVPAGGSPRYVRWFREEIRVAAEPAGLRAVHRLWILGLPLLTLDYAISEGSRGTAK